MGSNRRPRRGLFLLTAPPSPPLGSDLPDRFFFVFDDTTTTTTAKGEGHAIVVRAFDSVSRKRSDHHHPTVGDLGSGRSKSRSRSKTQSSSPGPRFGSGGVLTGLHFAFCIGISKRVPSTGPPAASRPSVHIKPAPAAARALSDAPTLQNVPIIHIAHWTKANSPHRFACQIQPRSRGPLKSSPKRSGSPRRLRKTLVLAISVVYSRVQFAPRKR